MSTDADVDYSGTVDAGDIEQQLTEDVVNGVEFFDDGTHSVRMMDPEKRLKIARELRSNEAASAGNPWFGLRTTRLLSPGAWE